KTQDRLRELVRAPQVGVRHTSCGQLGRQWFWPLLPKQKWLGCRAETRPTSHPSPKPASTINLYIFQEVG
ncbi:MAG: hypothetical protein OEW33_16265, partial [Nitrospirota bacterium]|nr:hypothetical protein [Nitrospirota bacterium]